MGALGPATGSTVPALGRAAEDNEDTDETVTGRGGPAKVTLAPPTLPAWDV